MFLYIAENYSGNFLYILETCRNLIKYVTEVYELCKVAMYDSMFLSASQTFPRILMFLHYVLS